MKLSIRSVAESLSAEVVKIPTTWFKSLHHETSVWDQLYEWLGRVGYAAQGILREQVYIGHNLWGKLLEAEKRRIRKKNPRSSPQKQRKALEWSNQQSCPKGCWGPQFTGISGNGLVVENPPGFTARRSLKIRKV